MDKFNELASLYNGGQKQCACGAIAINGICSDINCPIKLAFDNGFRLEKDLEQFPEIVIE